ncbi:MAG: LCP family protein [Anaerolineaceae bacterium]
MNNIQPKKRKSSLPGILILIVLILALAILSAVSLNRVREGEPGFLSNLWNSTSKTEAAAVLVDNGNILPIPKHVKTIMLLGSDFAPESGYRTDVILLVAFNLDSGKVNLFSFPRDLWVEIPGWTTQRINTAQPHGGFELLGDTLEYNFGFRPDHYAMVDFNGFKQIMTLIGGVDVEITQHMEDKCDFNEQKWCVVEPGTMHMDSDYALWYVRARLNTSDFDRTRRAQEVIQAIAEKILSPSDLGNLPKFIQTVQDVVETDMKLGDMWLYAFPLSKFFQDDLVTTHTLTPNEAIGIVTDDGAMVLQPNYPAIQAILNQVFWIE